MAERFSFPSRFGQSLVKLEAEMADEPKRFLGLAKLKSEGEPASFDEGGPEYDHDAPPPRGFGRMMRDADCYVVGAGPRWYVVRDPDCSSDLDDEEACVWTLSRSPDETGWETDSGYDGYGLTYAEARELADGVNQRDAREGDD
jgi:hypothetical protein